MSGDYSRWSFQPARDYAGVLAQQGRVHTDADWNELVEILLRRFQATSLDAIGRAGVPTETPDGFRIGLAGGSLTIGLGRCYVDGLLAENHGDPRDRWQPVLAELAGAAAIDWTRQPFLPSPPALPAAGTHVAYLRVWQREVTHVEQPSLVEKALGVDTTTRLQTAWQVRLLPVPPGTTCPVDLATLPGFADAEPGAAGRLSARTAQVTGEPDPCEVPPGGGYTGVENQLYRVEIHRGGGLGGANGATFKWSRDNATVAARVTEIPATLDRIVVDSLGHDDVLRFHDGDWVEILDDARELAGLPGEMRRIASGDGAVEEATRTIHLEQPLPAGAFPVDAQGRIDPAGNTRVRRWDQARKVLDADGNELADLAAAGSDGTIRVPSGATEVLLESGILIRFRLDPAGGRFRTGDHWLIPARTVDASVELPDRAPPLGIHVHCAPLALVTFPGTVDDCRTLFPPLAGLDSLEYVAGDGQEATPDPVTPAPVPLPVDPTVGVARGPLPVGGRTVRFTIEAGGGTLDGGPGPVLRTTGGDGLASVAWALDPATPVQRLRAELLDAAGAPTSLPVGFSARLRTAREVAYDPSACGDLAGVRTVQEAIDRLCLTGDHGDCCATVGRGGEFRDIVEAIDELRKRHEGHVCLCLLPERHELRTELITELRSLTISGRGAIVECPVPVLVTGVDDVHLGELTLVAGQPGLPRLLSFEGCGRVELASVTARLDGGDPTGSVLRFGEKLGQVRLRDCTLSNTRGRVVNDRSIVFDELPAIARRTLEASRPGLAEAESTALLTEAFAQPEADRRAVVSDLGALIERHGALLSERDRASLLALGTLVDEGAIPPPSRRQAVLDRLARLSDRLVPLGGGPGTVVELLDAGVDAWIEGCELAGGVVLYAPTTESLESEFNDLVNHLFAVEFSDAPPDAAPGPGRLTVAHNRIGWLTTSSKLGASRPFASVHVHDNTFGSRPNLIYGELVTVASNALDSAQEKVVNYLVVGGAVAVNGNLGSRHLQTLATWSRDGRGAGNARLQLVPALAP